ncbi:helix-turn-helix domain-containing protein [Brucella sp. 10RB9215]|uniref:helix-turn-helix domain-containing protein n=1 Tax=Brucella sp. 10RB9215 TaxID=1149953 RepID=UPI00155A760C|nr:helix-turn-helix transcriptional regulator [Brucella sp. 10RB9215]
MARREIEPKTPLGARIRDVRRHFGDEDREIFASNLNISRAALAYYERGERTPDADVLAAYHARYGININWLITGMGTMFEDTAKASVPATSPSINPSLMRKLGELVDMTFREERGRIRDLDLVVETGNAYNDLRSLVDDLTDTEAIEEALPLVKRRLKKRLADTANDPANRKHSA